MSLDRTELAEHLLAVPGFVDPNGVHHEFADKDHGQKFDWGAVSADMPVFGEVLESAAENIHEWGDPDAVLTVANGTTDIGFSLVEKMQEKYGSKTTLLVTQKNPATREVSLTDYTREILASGEVETLEIFDDIGTSGSTTAKLGRIALELGVKEVRTLYIMTRVLHLKWLDKALIPYRALTIVCDYPTYSPADCREFGYCSQDDWKLIEHGK